MNKTLHKMLIRK